MIPNIYINKLKTIISDISVICSIAWENGWAEANAGNISIDVSSLMEIDDYSYFQKTELDQKYKNLNNKILLLTASGSRFREISDTPLEHIGLIKFSEDGNYKYLLKDFKPTSELETHLIIHNIESNIKNKVVLHAHPDELIALSFLKKFKKIEFSYHKMFSSILPEVDAIIDDGIAYIPFYPPGSLGLVKASERKLNMNNFLIWERHGVVSIAEDLNKAYDKIDILNKAAKIYLLIK